MTPVWIWQEDCYVTPHLQVYLHNHLKLVLKYHTEDNEVYRVVGFEVEPASINTADITMTDRSCSLSAEKAKLPQEVSETGVCLNTDS